MSPVAALAILAGGFLGGVARVYVSSRLGARFGEAFPWGTLAVNITGCFAIGLLAGLAQRTGSVFAEPVVRDFLAVGFCGGFTTVSAFALQTQTLALDGEPRLAVLNVVASVALCLAAVAAGFLVGL